jgi:TP901 family phage tail tape measure protein
VGLIRGYLQILIRVQTRQAQAALASMKGELRQIDSAQRKAAAGAKVHDNAMRGMIQNGVKVGNQLQWTGRQLEYNWTLPVVESGKAMVTWALANEKAMVRVQKVYGDLNMAQNVFEAETTALERAFTALSNYYGRSKEVVTNIAGDWAAAGASGIALAKATELTLKAMVLGEMEATKATEALISIQSQYHLTTEGLNKTLAQLNIIENQTGISMQGLIEGFTRTAGVARNAGVTTRELGAMLAALVPASGSAANAGNALKTIISRLLAPTNEAREVMGQMGVNISEAGWQSLTASRRLELLSKTFKDLDDGQKAAVSSSIASRWQLNRFDILMEALTADNSYYNKALAATANESEYLKQATKELNMVLSSSPQRLQQIWVILQNVGADVIQPLIPLIVALGSHVALLAQKFADLPDEVKMALGIMLLFLAAIGPVAKYLGSFMTLIGTLGGAFGFLTRGLRGALPFLSAFVMLPFGSVGKGIDSAGKGIMRLGKAAVTSTNLTGILMGLGVVLRNFPKWLLLAFQYDPTGAMKHQGQIIKGGFYAMLYPLITLAVRFGKNLPLAIMAGLRALPALIWAFMVSPWGIAIAAVAAIIYAFRNQLAQLFSNISAAIMDPWNRAMATFGNSGNFISNFIMFLKTAFWSLPVEIQNAMIAVVTVVQRAALAVYGWLQYLNPFARHSPSLVDNVQNGMAAVREGFGTLSQIAAPIATAYAQIKSLKDLAASFMRGLASADRAEALANLTKVAPGAVPVFRALNATLDTLNAKMAILESAVKAQERVLAVWQSRLDAANDALDRQSDILDGLRAKANQYEDAIASANSVIADLSGAPLKGMRRMDDQIFANTQEQNKLRLEMLKMGDASKTYEDAANRAAMLAGAIETLNATKNDLRSGGAGQEILKFYDEEAKKLGKQKDTLEKQKNPYQELTKTLDELQRKADMLELEKALKFDGPIREIEKLAAAEKELSFAQIIAGIKNAQAQVRQYTPKLNEVNRAITEQERVLKQLEVSRNAIQRSYDAETAKLDTLKNSYSEVADAVRDVESALNDMSGAANKSLEAAKARQTAKKAKKDAKAGKLTPAGQAFVDAKGSNFPIQGDPNAKIGREGGAEDQSALIDKYTKDLAKQTGEMLASTDIFKPIRDQWGQVTSWFDKNIRPALAPSKSLLMGLFDGIDWTEPIQQGGKLYDTWQLIKSGAQNLWGTIKELAGIIWRLFAPEIIGIAKEIWAGLKDAFGEVAPEVAGLVKTMGPMLNLWKNIAVAIIIMVVAALKILAGIIKGVIRPLFKGLGTIIGGFIRVMRGVRDVFVGLFTMNPKMILGGFSKIFSGLFKMVWGALRGIVGILLGAVKGLISSVGDLIGELIKKVFGENAFKKFNKINDYVKGVLDDMIQGFEDTSDKIMEVLSGWWKGITGWFLDLWDELTGHSIVPDMLDSIVKCFQGLPDMLKRGLQALYDKVTGKFKDIWKWVTDTWLAKSISTLPRKFIKYVTEIPGKIQDAKKAIYDKFREIWTWVKDTWIGKSISQLPGKFMQYIKSIPGKLQAAKDSIYQKFRDIYNWFKNTWIAKSWHKVSDMFVKPIKDARRVISDVLTGKQSIKQVFSSAVTAIGKVWDKIQGVAARPIRFVINTVLNGGILGAYNKFVRKLFGKNTKLAVDPFNMSKNLKNAWVGGSIDSGPTGPGGKYTPKGIVHGGEHVIAKNEVEKWPGGHKGIERIRALVRAGRYKLAEYAEGGAVLNKRTWPTNTRALSPNYSGHSGVDIRAGQGAPIYAATAGRITHAGYGKGFGQAIFERGIDGLLQIYGHTSRLMVKAGDVVRQAQTIGLVGATGNASGPHLHMEIAQSAPGTVSNRAATLRWLAGASLGGNGSGKNGGGDMFVDPGYDKAHNDFLDAVTRASKRSYSGDKTLWQQMADGWGSMMSNAAKSKAKGLLGEAKKKLGLGKIPGGSGTSSGSDIGNQLLGKRLLLSAGFGKEQWPALKALWEGESNWRTAARNPSSGAYGIPQALPAGKMASAGADWRTNPATQIRWGLGYIKSVYGTPGGAYSKWNARSPHWYESGTMGSKAGWAMVGENGPELRNLGGGTKIANNRQSSNIIARSFSQSISRAFALSMDNAADSLEHAVVASVGAATRRAARRLETGGTGEPLTTSEGRGSTRTVVINNAHFPNVKNGEDAHAFLDNLFQVTSGNK